MRIVVSILLVMSVSEASTTYTTKPPCCRDHLSATTCSRLLKSKPKHFADRCNTDAEFRLVQCCGTCNKSGLAMAYDLIARSLVSANCFDRHGAAFCGRYVNSTDVFQPRPWTCDGENPQIAFRSCRLSCGFCDFKTVNYTLQNAQGACKNNKRTWRERWGSRIRKDREKILWE